MNDGPAKPAPDPYDIPPPWWVKHRDWAWALGAGVLTAVLTFICFPAVPPFNASEFAYAFAVPGIFWAYQRPSFKLYAWTMLAAQAVAWTALLWWLHPVTWLGLFLLGPVVGAWVGVWYLAVWWAMPRMAGRVTLVRLMAMLGLAGAWVIVEWTRTWLLGGFPWLPLAASQWQRTSVLQIAAYTGSYGVSFVLIAVNIGFAAYAHRLFFEGRRGFSRRSQEFFLALFLLLGCLCIHVQEAFNTWRFSRKLADVSIVQPYIPQEVKWDRAKADAIFRTLEQATYIAGASAPDFIVWPEATTPMAVRGNDGAKKWIEGVTTKAKAPLVLGSLAIENPGRSGEAWYNAVFVVAPGKGLQPAYYAKRHLVPFGEYVPLRFALGWLHKVVPVGEDDFAAGKSAEPLIVTGRRGDRYPIGALVCYEDIFPSLARSEARAGAELLFVATNNAWYGESAAAYQHAAHSVLRAVETRRPVLRCGNSGWSGWIDEFGVTRGVMAEENGSIYCRGVKIVPIRRDARWVGRQSFYTLYGDWFVAMSAGLVLLGCGALKFGGTVPVRVESV